VLAESDRKPAFTNFNSLVTGGTHSVELNGGLRPRQPDVANKSNRSLADRGCFGNRFLPYNRIHSRMGLVVFTGYYLQTAN